MPVSLRPNAHVPADVGNVISCSSAFSFFLSFFIYLFIWVSIYFFIIILILKSLILTCIPKHEPPSHLPPHNISLGHPHAPAPSMLHPTSDMDWRFVSYMIVNMFQCHSPKLSHLSLSLWVQKSALHICVSFAV